MTNISIKKKILLALLFLLVFVPRLYSQTPTDTSFNTLYGSVYSCVGFSMYPGYESILKTPKDSFFISASNYLENGYNFVKVKQNGDLIFSFGQREAYRAIPPEITQLVYVPGYGFMTKTLCGKIVTPLLQEALFSNCIGLDGKVYFGGSRIFNYDTISTTIFPHTRHFSWFAQGGKITSTLCGPDDPDTKFPRYSTTAGSNNRCIKVIPNDSAFCMLGVIDGVPVSVNNTTSFFNPGQGLNNFNDSAFYIMTVDSTGYNYNGKCFGRAIIHTGEQDAMQGIIKDANSKFVAVGHLQLTGKQDRLHIVKVDSNLVVVSNSVGDTVVGSNQACPGTGILQAGNGDYIIIGNYLDATSSKWMPYVLSANPSSLAKNWSYKYPLTFAGMPTNAKVWNIIRTNTDAYMLVGTCDQGMFLLNITNNGTPIWSKCYGGSSGYSVVQTNDSGYAAAGSRYRCATNDMSIYSVRTNKTGVAECASQALGISNTSLNWGSKNVVITPTDNMNLDTGGLTSLDDPRKVCPTGGTLEQYTVCPECCFQPYADIITTVNTNPHCVGDSMVMKGHHTDLYRFEWYVNGRLVSTADSLTYIFRKDGDYDFTIHIIMKDNPKCMLIGCNYASIYPTNKGFSYILAPGGYTPKFVYNDTNFTNEFYWKWTFDGGSPIEVTKGSAGDSDATREPVHTFTVGMHKVCITVRTGSPLDYCESTVCRYICIQSTDHSCCDCQ